MSILISMPSVLFLSIDYVVGECLSFKHWPCLCQYWLPETFSSLSLWLYVLNPGHTGYLVVIFLLITHERLHIIRPWGWDMDYLPRILYLADVLVVLLLLGCVQYHIIIGDDMPSDFTWVPWRLKWPAIRCEHTPKFRIIGPEVNPPDTNGFP